MKKINIQELKKENNIKNLRNEDIKKIISTCELDGYGIKRTVNKILKEEQKIENIKNQKQVKTLYININWVRSYMWGWNPHATATVFYKDGTNEIKQGYTCSGCGYDKESTVIAQIFNEFLKYKIINKKKTEKTPYGVHLRKDFITPFYDGGIGTNCYYRIARYIGGKFQQVGNTKTISNFIVEF